MSTLVFFLEEPSAKEMLMGVLPRMLPDGFEARFHIFSGKQDLQKNLLKRLQGWRTPDCKFIIIQDQDSGDCRIIKEKLKNICIKAGKNDALVRIACHELETFYLGDLEAVERGLGIKGIAKQQQKKKYRSPDALGNPSEELFSLTSNVYDKVAGSRAIAPFLNLYNNNSKSFRALITGIGELAK
jgi:hypothetical protein